MDPQIWSSLIVATATIIAAVISAWATIKVAKTKTGATTDQNKKKPAYWLWGTLGAVVGGGVVLLLILILSPPPPPPTSYIRKPQKENPAWLLEMIREAGISGAPAVAIKPSVPSHERGETHYLSVDGKRYSILHKNDRVDSQEFGYGACPGVNWIKYTDANELVWKIASCDLEGLEILY